MFKDKEFSAVTLVTVLAAIVILSYTIASLYFGWKIADNPSEWGPFGDFFGGLLGPVIAITALYLLYRANLHQKTQLLETRQHFQIEVRRTEIYTVISHIDSTIREMLAVELRHDRPDREGSSILRIGVLSQYLKPGWRPPRGIYIAVGPSDLCTPILGYLTSIRDQISLLEEFLREYDSVMDEESSVTRYFNRRYLPIKEVCESLVKNQSQ